MHIYHAMFLLKTLVLTCGRNDFFMIYYSVFLLSMAFNLHKRYKHEKMRDITRICAI